MAKGKLALGALIGAAAGFVTGVLLAPKSGKETRKDIKDGALKAKDAAVEKAEELKGKATQVAEDVTKKANTVKGDVTEKAEELKSRVEQAVEGAQKGFNKKPTAKSNTVKKK